MNTRERVPHAPARAFDFVPLAEQLRRQPAKPQRLACPAIAQKATAGATSVRDSSFEGKKSDGRIAERTRRDGATPVPLPSGSALDLFAPVAQSPERDAWNVGDAGGSPAGSAIFPLRGKINGIRNANSAGMSTGPARRACLLSSALLGIRGVWCKSTAFRHLANIPECEAAQATAGPEVGRPAGTSRWKRPAGDVRPCSRSPTSRGTTSRTSPVPVRIWPRAPLSRSRSHSRPAPDFYSGEVRVQLPPAPPDHRGRRMNAE